MKKVNAGMLAEGIAFTLLGATLFLMSVTGAYMYYVTPRTVPYLYFASAVLLLLGINALCSLFDRAHIRHYSHLMILLIPLLFIVWSVHDTGIIPKLAEQSSAARKAEVNAVPAGETYVMQASVYSGTMLHGYDGMNRKIVIPEEETYMWLVEIFENPEPFLGFTITTMGQVMKDPAYFDAGYFSPVRKLMTCCAADLYPIGFTCEYDGVDSLETDVWVSVTGMLEMRTYDDYSELTIVAGSVSPCAPATEPYLFSY